MIDDVLNSNIWQNKEVEALFPIILAALLAALPGLDRERRLRPAGLRTHMIVSVSAAMITILARLQYGPHSDSTARIVANVLTGIGFLGAGVIMQRKKLVHDVTTAASIWMVALVGIVVGYGYYILATGSTLLLGFILVIVRQFEDKAVTHPAELAAMEHNQENNDNPEIKYI